MNPGLPLHTLNDIWLNTVAKVPRKIAVVMDGNRWSYEELEARIGQLAGGLAAWGIQPGDRVAVAMPNCLDFYVAYWAILRVGAILSPINFRLGRQEMSYVFTNLEPRLAFIHPEVLSQVAPSIPAECTPVLSGPALPSPLPTAHQWVAWQDLLQSHPLHQAVPLATEDLAIIAHTSGTTGVPKGAMMRHCDLLFNIRNTVIPFGWRHEDTTLLLVPLFHVTGLYSIVPSCVYLGSTVVIAPRPDPGEVAALLEQERVTNFLSVPTFHHLLSSLDGIESRDLSGLRMIGYSGSPMPERTIQRLHQLFPQARLHNFFGLTETISLTHITPADCALSHAHSIGKVIPEVGMKILRENGSPYGEDGSPCGFDETGLLHIYRGNTISGYWNRPGLLEASLTEDQLWFNTGDLARADEDGFVYLEGRKKDMIIVAGENVYALEVERCILSLQGVQEVAVVGVPATGVRTPLGELVKAVVVPAAGCQLSASAIKRHCAARLASYKVPHLVELAESLPRNPSGKVLKDQLV